MAKTMVVNWLRLGITTLEYVVGIFSRKLINFPILRLSIYWKIERKLSRGKGRKRENALMQRRWGTKGDSYPHRSCERKGDRSPSSCMADSAMGTAIRFPQPVRKEVDFCVFLLDSLYHPHRRPPPSSPALSMVLLLAAAPRGEASGGSIAQPLWYIVNSIGVSMCYSSTWPALVFIHCCCASPTCVSSPSSACHGRWITGVVSPRTNVVILRQRRGEKCSLGQRLSDMLHHLAESTPMVWEFLFPILYFLAVRTSTTLILDLRG